MNITSANITIKELNEPLTKGGVKPGMIIPLDKFYPIELICSNCFKHIYTGIEKGKLLPKNVICDKCGCLMEGKSY